MTGLAAVLAATGCASSGAVPRPFPGATTSAPVDHEDPGAPAPPDLLAHRFDGRAVAAFALGFRGVPYRLGGADPGGFDCSGLVQYVFARYGVSVPRVVEQQYESGRKIKASEVVPGDLVFFDTKGRGRDASHVGIAIGENQFVHAPNSNGVVRVEALGSTYWGARYIGARRMPAPSTTD